MTQILYRYKLVLLLVALVIAVLVTGVVLYRNSTGKIPSRGVFVLDCEVCHPAYPGKVHDSGRVSGRIG